MFVAREQNGDLYFFVEKPTRITPYGTWIWGNQNKCIKIDSSLFPDLKWEDEPIEIHLLTDLQIAVIQKEAYKNGYDSGYDNCIENEFN